MPILSDLHVHSSYSTDSNAPMEEMIKQAITKGLHSICFTEHVDLEYPETPDYPAGSFQVNVDSFLYELLGYKSKYADKIEVLFGLECGMQPHLSRENAKIIKEHEFDFILGSVHMLDGKDVYYPSFYENITEEEALRMYLESTYQNIRSFGNFDSLAHLDYIIRYCKNMDCTYDYDKYKDIIDPILKHLINREKALELNTGALRKGMKQCNPCFEVLKRFHDLGGEYITIGSDAHAAQDVGCDFDKAAELLKACGYEYYTVFSGRIPMQKKL